MVKNLPANAGDIRDNLDPWVSKVPWRRAWQPNSSILAQRNPQTEEPGRLLPSIGSQRVGHNLSNLACTHFQVHEASLCLVKTEKI